jgi:hypothetical protein
MSETPPDLCARFVSHFGSLVQSDADAVLLQALAAQVLAFEDASGALKVTLHSKKYDSNVLLTCRPPFDGPAHTTTPPGVLALARLHNGMTTPVLGGGIEGFFGLEPNGQISSGNWTRANADLLELPVAFSRRLQALGVIRIDSPFDFERIWLVIDPTRKTAAGEPALSYVARKDLSALPPRPTLDVLPLLAAEKLGYGSVLLRIWAQLLLDQKAFPEIG